jgi:dTDP-glucose 4,6-dehydratase
MRILVTGGMGTVGRPLVKELKKRGHEVFVCDLAHSHQDWYRRCDVSEFHELVDLFDSLPPIELVYHAAAEFGRHNGEQYSARLWKTNVVGTKHMLRLQRELDFRMVFFSSSEIYGDYDGVMHEDVPLRHPIRLLNDYAMTKWVSEMMIMNETEAWGNETVRVRLFNTYGPGEYFTPFRSVIARFCYYAIQGMPYVVHRDHKRSFIYIDDAVNTLANITDHFEPGEVYNIGSTKLYSIEELSDKILRLTGRRENLAYFQDRELLTTKQKIVDTDRANEDLDHKITVDIDEGLTRTIEWMRQVYHSPESDHETRFEHCNSVLQQS